MAFGADRYAATKPLLSLLLIPLAMPGLLFSMAYVFLLMPKSGLLNVFLRDALSFFGVELSEGPVNIYSLGGIIFWMACAASPPCFSWSRGHFASWTRRWRKPLSLREQKIGRRCSG